VSKKKDDSVPGIVCLRHLLGTTALPFVFLPVAPRRGGARTALTAGACWGVKRGCLVVEFLWRDFGSRASGVSSSAGPFSLRPLLRLADRLPPTNQGRRLLALGKTFERMRCAAASPRFLCALASRLRRQHLLEKFPARDHLAPLSVRSTSWLPWRALSANGDSAHLPITARGDRGTVRPRKKLVAARAAECQPRISGVSRCVSSLLGGEMPDTLARQHHGTGYA